MSQETIAVTRCDQIASVMLTTESILLGLVAQYMYYVDQRLNVNMLYTLMIQTENDFYCNIENT